MLAAPPVAKRGEPVAGRLRGDSTGSRMGEERADSSGGGYGGGYQEPAGSGRSDMDEEIPFN